MIQLGSNDEAKSFVKYVGFTTMRVLAINPDQTQLSGILRHDVDKAPEYVTMEEGVEQLRIDIWLAPGEDGSPLPPIKYPVFLKRQPMKSQAGTTKVIDRYGNSAWVTDEEFKAQAVPKTKSGKAAAIIPPYELCCDGQDRLLEFLRAWLNIPVSMSYDETKGWMPKPDLSKSECRLEKMKDYWRGDVSELKQLVTAAANYKIKTLLTVRNVQVNGSEKTYQSIFPKVVQAWRDPAAIEKEFKRQKDYGGLVGVETYLGDVKEYVPTIAQPQATTPANNPWADTPTVVSPTIIAQQNKELPF